LHCNGNMSEMREVASETPVLSGPALRRANHAKAFRNPPRPFDRIAGRAELDDLLQRAKGLSA
jgi:beta-N-acetylhexosaminidase